MNETMALSQESRQSVLRWAIERQSPLAVTTRVDGSWDALRSQFLRCDLEQGLIQILYPVAGDHQPAPEIVEGQTLGVSFRRGHKKCVFVSPVVMRRAEKPAEGAEVDTLIIRVPAEMRELQRRAYQRVFIPSDKFIAVKLFKHDGGAAQADAFPLCAGRVGNLSVGGVLVEVRSDQNPRLGVDETVRVEITAWPGKPPLNFDARYRHCVRTSDDHVGLGLQFLGLEHQLPGRSSLGEAAEFVKQLQRAGRKYGG